MAAGALAVDSGGRRCVLHKATLGCGPTPHGPHPASADDEMTCTKFGRPILASFDYFSTFKKKVISDPHHIHLRVQRIPLINLMGLMKIYERGFV